MEPTGSAVGLVVAVPWSLGLSSSVAFHQWRPGFLLSVEVLGDVVAALVVSLLECDALVASCLWASSALVSRALKASAGLLPSGLILCS